ncbi:MAG: hypothetical protein WC668_03445 [Patescibacteria group bacterium]|jgi:hypothetical protein
MPSPERFLHNKFEDLQKTPEVASASARKKIRVGEKVANTPEGRLGTYLDRLEEIFSTPEEEYLKGQNLREFRLDYLKNKILDSAIPLRHKTIDDLPGNFFDLDKRVAREQGHGDIEVTREMQEQILESAVKDQEAGLSNWFDYLSSEDAMYPTWLKYFALRSVTGLAEFDKQKHEFKKRSQFTRGVFPDLNREALALVLDIVNKRHGVDNASSPINAELGKILEGANFAKLYAYAIEKVTPASQEQKENIQGQWVKYDQGDDYQKLCQSLQGHGTGWCTAGESTAQAQLKEGDFYVYYSNNDQGQPKIPRIAIRMQNDQIAEIGGINAEQNLEPALVDIAQDKARTLPGHESYEKKSQDMSRLTALDKKIRQGKSLDKEDLIFLYEINSPIEGFGYQKDPRIKELRGQRDKNADMLVIFDCKPSQIIHNKQELEQALKQEKDIKVYVGELFLNIFKLLPSNLEHIYTEFPEGRIKQKTIELGTGLKTKDDFIKAIEKKGGQTSDWAKDIMGKPEFAVAKKETKEKLIILAVADLGFKGGAKLKDIYEQAKKLGLEFCPPETGPQLRLQYTDQPLGEWILIGMEPISGSGGDPSVFDVERSGGEPWLGAYCGGPGRFYYGVSRFAFVSASNT